MEATCRLLASIAHEVRSAVASIVYSADFLDARAAQVEEHVLRATMHEIGAATRRLQLTVDSLLDYARLGPTISVPISLRDVLSRAQGLLRSFHRDGARGLHAQIAAGAEWVRGNPVVVEQIFVNLLLSAVACADAPTQVTFSARVAQSSPSAGGIVEVRVTGGERLFASTAPAPGSQAEGAALSAAEAAAAAQGGELVFERGAGGCSIVVRLPRSEGPR